MPLYNNNTFNNTNNTEKEILASISEAKERYMRTGDIKSLQVQENVTWLSTTTGLAESEIEELIKDNTGQAYNKIIAKYNDEQKNSVNGIFDSLSNTLGNIFTYVLTGESAEDRQTYTDGICGMPFRFNPHADPAGRIYNKVLMRDMPIVTFVPGRPERRVDTESGRTFEEYLSSANYNGGNNYLDASDYGITTNSNSSAGKDAPFSWLLKSQKNRSITANFDTRYYHLKPSYTEYLNIVELLLTAMAVKMGIVDKEHNRIRHYINSYVLGYKEGSVINNDANGIRFVCDKNINPSQSINNTFKESMFASSTKEISDISKEVQFLMGRSSALENMAGFATKVTDAIANVGSSLLDTLTGGGSGFSGLTDTIMTGANAALAGVNLYYPEIWNDSSFSQNFSLNFTFTSPYGNTDAIFEYVIVPFVLLLVLAMPLQVLSNGYTSPFLIMADIPSQFTTDLAVITDMSWERGGGENLFNKDGLPMVIKCSISIKDLYPIFGLPSNWGLLRHNPGMHGFIDNLAGLSMFRWTPAGDFVDNIKGRLEYTIGGRTRNQITGWVEDAVAKLKLALRTVNQ